MGFVQTEGYNCAPIGERKKMNELTKMVKRSQTIGTKRIVVKKSSKSCAKNTHYPIQSIISNGTLKMCLLTVSIISLTIIFLSSIPVFGLESMTKNGSANSNNNSHHLNKLFATGSTVLHPILAPNLTGVQGSVHVDANKLPIKLASPQVANGTLKSESPVVKAHSNATGFAEQTSSSLFRPSFFKGLLGGGGGSGSGPRDKPADEEEEEEEVTQTIEVPMAQAISGSDTVQSSGSKNSAKSAKQFNQANLLRSLKRQQQLQLQEQQLMFQRQQADFQASEMQPRPEASFRLSNSEMSNILNDREAPEFYREREKSGDGVLVGEEQQPRLGTAASDRMNSPGSGMMGGYMGGYGGMSTAGFGGDTFGDQRLAQAGSGDPSMGGFNHRFGQQQGYGRGAGSDNDQDDEDEAGPGERGRLMQSPNEFNEINSQQGNYGPMDYSPQSGFLRAGSGDYGAEGFGGENGGFSNAAAGMSSGYTNSPMLDRHASEMYGPGSGGAGSGDVSGFGGPDFGMQNTGGYDGRLNQAGSHMGDSNFGLSSGLRGGGGGGGGFGDDYSARFGHSSGGGFSQQGFATQNNLMLRGNSMRSNSMDDSSADQVRPAQGGTKLVPLTPVVPVAEELLQGNAGFSDSASMDPMRSGSRPRQQKQRQQPEVHEALDDDIGPGDTSDSDDSESSGSHYDSSSGDDSDNGPSTDESIATTMATDGGSPPSQHQHQVSQTPGKMAAQMPARMASTGDSLGGRQNPGLIMGSPSGSPDNRYGQQAANLYQHQVEFNRIGSAGYLAPSMTDQSASGNGARSSNHLPRMTPKQRLLKKTSGFLVQGDAPHRLQHQHQQRSSARDGADYDPAENPAHAGKYIID